MKLAESDLWTPIGKTLHYVADKCGAEFEELTPSLVKRKLQYMDIPENEKWRIVFAN